MVIAPVTPAVDRHMPFSSQELSQLSLKRHVCVSHRLDVAMAAALVTPAGDRHMPFSSQELAQLSLKRHVCVSHRLDVEMAAAKARRRATDTCPFRARSWRNCLSKDMCAFPAGW